MWRGFDTRGMPGFVSCEAVACHSPGGVVGLSRYPVGRMRQGIGVEFSEEQWASLRALLAGPDTPADVAARARMVVLRGQGHSRGEVARRCGVSVPTVERWVSRFTQQGVAVLNGRSRGRAQVPERVRRRVLERAASAPPADSGLAGWTTRSLAEYLLRTENVTVSNSYIATVLRGAGARPPAAPTQQPRSRRRSEPLDAHFEPIVVDGAPARALEERQTEAITAILQWLRAHPE